MDDSVTRAARNVSNMALGRLATQIVLLISVVVIPRVLGLENFGLYAALIAVVAILDAVATGGLQMAEIRLFAPAWRESDQEPAVGLASTIWISRIILSATAGLLAVAWLTVFTSLEVGLDLAILTGTLVTIRAAIEATRHLFLSISEVGRMALFEFLRVSATLAVVVTVFEWLDDLTAVFVALPLAYLPILAVAVGLLLRRIPIQLARFDWCALRMMAGFSAFTLLGSIAWAAQAQFATYAIANWISLAEAALVALTIQIYLFFQTLVISIRSAVLPILAEIESAGSTERLFAWGGMMMRWGAAMTTIATVGWALLGELALRLLPPDFAPVYWSGSAIMAGVIAMTCAAVCNGLLYVSGFAGWASFSQIVFAAVTIAGVLILVTLGDGATAFRVAVVYAVAAVVFFGVSYITLTFKRGIRLPLRRTALLIAPALLALPALIWSGSTASKLLLLVLFGVAYLSYAVALGLLPRAELYQIRATLRASPNAKSPLSE